MRSLDAERIEETVYKLCRKANTRLPTDVADAIESALDRESLPRAKTILEIILKNAEIAAGEDVAICQDTGQVVIFVDLGQDLHIGGGSLEAALQNGVRRAYRDGFFRNSIVQDPLLRENTGDNTPAVVHYTLVPGDTVKIAVMPKGFGSENMSGVSMLKPADGEEGVVRFVLDSVITAGGNPCPPIIVGVGLGGTMEKAALLAKRSLLRTIGSRNAAPHLRALEARLLDEINRTGIGPQGLGGAVTALDVFIESFPTHIAGLPVAVNLCCHAARHETAIL